MQHKKVYIGSYEVLEKIGEGGFGVVYRAKDHSLDRDVAIKVLAIKKSNAEAKLKDQPKSPEQLKKQKAFEERFIKEAQNAAKLDHPNIAKIYYAGIEKGMRYFAMEYINGNPLDDIVDENGPLNVPLTLHIVYYAVSALAEALKYGIIHRDIKPGNIMLTEDYTVKIVDFGLSKLMHEDSSITAEGSCFGTPHFMSPEQCKGDPLDFRSDIYSLGITMFYMLTHKYPFEADKTLAILNKHVNQEIPDVSLFASDRITPDVEDLLSKMTNKNPEDRFQSYIVLLSTLKKLRLRYPFVHEDREQAILNDVQAEAYANEQNTDEFLEQHKNMKEDFKNLIKNGDVFEIEEFLIKYPENDYSRLLEEKLLHLRDEAEKFKKAEMIDVYEEWQKFVKLFPDGKYSQYAYERLTALEEIKERENNKKAQKVELFERAKKKNTKEDYEQFLMLYPNTEESVHVRRLLEKLESNVRILDDKKDTPKPGSTFIRLIEKSESLIKEQNYTEALEIINNIISKNPGHCKAKLLRDNIYKIRPQLSPYNKMKQRQKCFKHKKILLYVLVILLCVLLLAIDLYAYRLVLTNIVPEITKNYIYINGYALFRPLLFLIRGRDFVSGMDDHIKNIEEIVIIRRNLHDAIENKNFIRPSGDNFIYYFKKLNEIEDNDRYLERVKAYGIGKMLEIASSHDRLMRFDEADVLYENILIIDPDNREVARRYRIREYKQQ